MGNSLEFSRIFSYNQITVHGIELLVALKIAEFPAIRTKIEMGAGGVSFGEMLFLDGRNIEVEIKISSTDLSPTWTFKE